MKTKFLAIVGGLGGFCVLCCTLPLFGVLGFATIEVFMCDNLTLQIIGGSVAVVALFFIVRKQWPRFKNTASSCTVNCGCKPSI